MKAQPGIRADRARLDRMVVRLRVRVAVRIVMRIVIHRNAHPCARHGTCRSADYSWRYCDQLVHRDLPSECA